MKETKQESPEPANSWFKIIVLDVGQGDATLLIEPNGKAVIIDTGPAEQGDQAIQEVLTDQQTTEIQKIFISHDHADHTGGLAGVLEAFALDPSILVDKTNAMVGQIFALGGATIQVKAANGQIGSEMLFDPEQNEDENNLSLALLIQYGDIRYLTTGDLPGGGGEPPYDTIDLETSLAPLIGDIDIFLVPHHGSHTSSNENFLDGLAPEVGIISVGNENEFFHPHPSVIQRLKDHDIQIYQTEKGWLEDTEGIEIVNGHICILTDGAIYLVEPYRIDKCTPPS